MKETTEYLLVDTFIKEIQNWSNIIDLDDFNLFYELFQPYLSRLYFYEKPKHPHVISILLTKPQILQSIASSLKMDGFQESTGRIWLYELPLEESIPKLQEQGIPMRKNNVNTIITFQNGDCFVNFFLSEDFITFVNLAEDSLRD